MSTAESIDTQTTKAIVEKFYASIFADDWDAVRTCIHDEIELWQPPTLPYGKIYHGPDEVMPLWQNVIVPLADAAAVDLQTFVAQDDTVVAIARTTIKGGGEEIIACEEYKVRDGLIARIRMFWYDPTPVAEAAKAKGITAPL